MKNVAPMRNKMPLQRMSAIMESMMSRGRKVSVERRPTLRKPQVSHRGGGLYNGRK